MSEKFHFLIQAVKVRKKHTNQEMGALFNIAPTTYPYWADGSRKFTNEEVRRVFEVIKVNDPELIRMIIARNRKKWIYSYGWRWGTLLFLIMLCVNMFALPDPADKTSVDKLITIRKPDIVFWVLTPPIVGCFLYFYMPTKFWKKRKKEPELDPVVKLAISIVDHVSLPKPPPVPSGVIKVSILAIFGIINVAIMVIFYPEKVMTDSPISPDMRSIMMVMTVLHLMVALGIGWALYKRLIPLLRYCWIFLTVSLICDIGFDRAWDPSLSPFLLIAALILFFHVNRKLNEVEEADEVLMKILDLPKL